MATAVVAHEETFPAPRWRPLHTFLLLMILAAVAVVGVALPQQHSRLDFIGERTVVAWLAIGALMAAFASVAGHGVTGLWRGVLIDDRHRLSLSRLQMLLWTILVLSAYMAAALANIGRDTDNPLAVDIPSELWLAMGISTASLVVAPVALAYKEGKRPGQLDSQPALESSRFSDLFRGEEVTDYDHLDLGKVQMFLFTVVVLLGYGLAVGDMFGSTTGAFSTLPAVDEAVVTLLAISHAGYLAKKAVPTSAAPTGEG